MSLNSDSIQIVITPKIYISLEQQDNGNKLLLQEKPQNTIPIIWVQDGMDFRLDIALPEPGSLDILFPVNMESLHVNGETVWEKNLVHPIVSSKIQVAMTTSGLRFSCASGHPLHILAHISDKGESMRSDIRSGTN